MISKASSRVKYPAVTFSARVVASTCRKASSAPKLSSAVQVSQPQKIRSRVARSINSCSMVVADRVESQRQPAQVRKNIRVFVHQHGYILDPGIAAVKQHKAGPGKILDGRLQVSCIGPVSLAHPGMDLNRKVQISRHLADLEKQVILKCFNIHRISNFILERSCIARAHWRGISRSLPF